MLRMDGHSRFWWRQADGPMGAPLAEPDPLPDIDDDADLGYEAEFAPLQDAPLQAVAAPEPPPALDPHLGLEPAYSFEPDLTPTPRPRAVLSAKPEPELSFAAGPSSELARDDVISTESSEPVDAPDDVAPASPALSAWRLRRHPSLHLATPIMRTGPLAVAGVVGALLFAGLTGIYGSSKLAEPLPRQIDRALVNIGLGINEISLTGHRYTLDSDIFAALESEETQSLVHFNVARARERVEALPWVETANVQRILPDRLRIEIVERRPAAVWLMDDREGLVDRTGRLLAWVTPGRTTDLPRIAGEGAPAAAAGLFMALAAEPAIASRVELATRIGDRRWTLTLNGGTIVHLPAGREPEGLRRLADLEARNRVMETGGQEVDLRVDGQIAVRDVAKKSASRGEAGKARQTM